MMNTHHQEFETRIPNMIGEYTPIIFDTTPEVCEVRTAKSALWIITFVY